VSRGKKFALANSPVRGDRIPTKARREWRDRVTPDAHKHRGWSAFSPLAKYEGVHVTANHAKYTKKNLRPAATEPQNSLCPLCLTGENNHGDRRSPDLPDVLRVRAANLRTKTEFPL